MRNFLWQMTAVALLVAILLWFTGCATKPIPKPEPTDPPTIENPLKWQNQEWDKILRRAIATEGINLLEFNPDKTYWEKLFVAMAKFESNFKTNLQYRENFKDRHGNYIISRGLFQLSYESSLGYSCPIQTPEDLHKPFYNINCAVRIMNRWVKSDNCVSCKSSGKWRGGARYWSVLRFKMDEIKSYM